MGWVAGTPGSQDEAVAGKASTGEDGILSPLCPGIKSGRAVLVVPEVSQTGELRGNDCSESGIYRKTTCQGSFKGLPNLAFFHPGNSHFFMP